jgi:hypothetical protein
VHVQINGNWNEATVVDEGVGKRKISVILNDDSTLSLVKVQHSKVRPVQTSIDRGINDKLNFDDLCEAITFLHAQKQQNEKELLDSINQSDKNYTIGFVKNID